MLIDNNVLVDLALDRKPYSLEAEELLNRIQQTATPAFVAWHSVATLFYVANRAIGRSAALTFIERLADFITVVPTGGDALRYALSLPMRDFEDAMQVAAAHTAGAQYIVTRNIRDFVDSPIPAIAPERARRELLG